MHCQTSPASEGCLSMGCYLLRKQLCFPTRCSGTAMICSRCKMMIICNSQTPEVWSRGFAELYLLPKLMQYLKSRLAILLFIHLISLSSLLWLLLTLKHPEEALGSWSQPLDHSHTSTASHLWWSSASHWKPQVEELTKFFNSFILCICFSDRFEQQSPFLSHFLLNKEAFQECWSTLCLSCEGAMLSVTMSVLHWVRVPFAKSCPPPTWP